MVLMMRMQTIGVIMLLTFALSVTSVHSEPAAAFTKKTAPPSLPGLTTAHPPTLELHPGAEYATPKWIAGGPGIECTAAGRLWVTWYGGPAQAESPKSDFAVLVTSNDEGKTWSEPVAAYDPGKLLAGSNTVDPHLWIDPRGRLWWSINRALKTTDKQGSHSDWAFCAEDAEKADTGWKPPVFVGYGVALNKPTALSTGEWIQPIDTFNSKVPGERTQFYRSVDGGKSYQLLSHAAVKEVSFSEHMLVERKDGSLVVFVRTKYGIAQAESKDKGATWINEKPFTDKMNVDTRVCFRKLKSGNWLLVVDDSLRGRARLTALLSTDEGKTWPCKLLLDEREASNYPDVTQDDRGNIYVAYARGRSMKDQQEILFARIAEEDIKAGKVVRPGSLLVQPIKKFAAPPAKN